MDTSVSNNIKDILKLSGMLATASENVINSNLNNLSDNIKKLETALKNYNNAIFNETIKK